MSDPHSRFWASIESFRCACPACQALILATQNPGRIARTKVHAHAYDRRSQVLKCPWCGRKFVAGLLLWPLPLAQQGRRKTPPDVRPTARELAEFRNLYAGGWWMREAKWNGDPVNLAIPEECTCAPAPWSASCPVHGNESLLESSDDSERKG